jgi:hypothetical protein
LPECGDFFTGSFAALDEEHRGTPRHWAEVSVTVSNNPKCRAVAAYLAGLEAS